MSLLTAFSSKRRDRILDAAACVAVNRRIRQRTLGSAAAMLVVAAIALAPTAIAKDGRDDGQWVGTWSASPQPAAPLQISAQTVRQVVHTSLGGSRVRVRLSNVYGTSALMVGSAHVALSAGGGSIFQDTDRVLQFNGSPTISIPPGALIVSDAVRLDVPALGDLAVSLYLPDNVAATTQHSIALQTTYISAPGDFTDAISMAGTTTQSLYFLTGVEVGASEARAIVALGDSLTDGFGSTPEMNRRWTNVLAERLQSNPGTSRVAVLNAGISGNRLLHDLVGTNALARLDRDALVQTGARYVIVSEGNNDFGIPGLIGNPAEDVTAEQVIQAHRQIIDRVHALGLRIYGSTLNPIEGILFPNFYSAALEAKRQAVNRWIRTSNAYDAVIDFDLVLRDPSHPTRILPAYDSGDHGHPNDAGYAAMAGVIDLSLFRDDED